MPSSPPRLDQSLGTWHVMVAGVALVVAASTLVSDFAGFFALGFGFVVALLLGFLINLLLGISAAELAVAYPWAGALYDYARAIFKGERGAFLGVFLGLSFFGMFAFAASGETAAGAFSLKALLGVGLPVEIFIIVLGVLAVIPNILGIRTTAWVSVALLLLMLGIRWFFGLAGFFGFAETGVWSPANLDAGSGFALFGERGIVTLGLALAFWSFVGIEFVCSLAEEVNVPRKALPRGMLLGLLAILATSLVMGLGVTGTAPLSIWQAASVSPLGCGGDCPQLAVGQIMFGTMGHRLMALASVAATLGTLTVAYAAMPRVLYSMARDGHFFGPLSKPFGTLHPRFKTPVAATLLTFSLYLIPALYSHAVIDWLFSAAYAWIILYVIFHVLALVNRRRHPDGDRAFSGRWFIPAAFTGIGLTLFGLYYAFAGSHLAHGGRALVLFLLALTATTLSFRWSRAMSKSTYRGIAQIIKMRRP